MRASRPGILIALVLLALAIGGLLLQRLRGHAAREAAVGQLLADVDAEIKKPAPDSDELARLKRRLEQLPDHDQQRELVVAAARIERARGRDSAAWELLGPHATLGDAGVDELRLGAELLLQLHASSGDRALAQQARGLALRAYAESHDAGDLLAAWQAAHRIGDTAAASDSAALLRAQHQDSAAARLVALVETPADGQPAAQVRELEQAFAAPPLELDLARAVLLLEQTDLPAARELLERLAARSPALLDVRHLCAIACHMVAATQGQFSDAERQRARAQRDAHLHFCIAHADADDPRLPKWRQLLGG